MEGSPNAQESIRVLVVEQHAIVREGVCTLLQREPDIRVVGSVGSGEEAIELLEETRPNVVLMGVGLPGVGSIEATRKLRVNNPDVSVLAFTLFADDQYVLGMLDAGAAGYLFKQSAVDDLVQAIRTVSNGQCFLDPAATKAVIESLRERRERFAPGDGLTDREKDVLRFIAQGYTSKEIGRKLRLSPKTVENYRARILKKLQARNCSEAISSALRQRIIQPVSYP